MRLFFAAMILGASATLALAQTNPLRRPAPQETAAPQPGAAPQTQATAPSEPKTKAKARTGATGNFAERRKRCSADWANAKATNATGGQKWPQFWSACNTRLKAAGV